MKQALSHLDKERKGTAIGSLIGLIGGPLGAGVGAAIGATTGASIKSRAGLRMLLRFFMHTLECAFFIGLAGSLVVSVMSFVEDLHEFFQEDRVDSPPQQEHRMQRAA